MPTCCGCASTAPAASSVSASGRHALSTRRCSTPRRRRATSWRCSDQESANARLPGRGERRARQTTLGISRPLYYSLRRRSRGGGGVARERRLGAREVEEIFTAFAEAMRELPPDVEAGWLDAQGDLRLAPDIARKLRTARRVRQLLQELRQRQRES